MPRPNRPTVVRRHPRRTTNGKIIVNRHNRMIHSKNISKIDSSVSSITNRITKLLYSPPKDATNPKIFRIIAPKDKLKYFDFLKGYSVWDSIGKWHIPKRHKKYMTDYNVTIEIIFRDTDDKIIGTKLTELFAMYNQKAIGMKSLLTSIYPLEKTSLFQ